MALTRTVQQVIEVAAEHEEMNPVRGLQLFTEAHQRILASCHLVPDSTVDITLVAGQMEYALPDSCIRIWDAAYWNSASSTDYQPLKATNVDTLFYDRGPNWQLAPASTPDRFYERGGVVGLVPAPSVATTAGYPKVTLYYTQFVAPTLLGSLPSTITSVYPWVYHMCMRQAAVKDPAKVPFYESRFRLEMTQMQTQIFGRVGRDKPRVGGMIPKPRGA